MFLRHFFTVALLLGVLALGTNAFATSYDITASSADNTIPVSQDVIDTDGVCTLREAFLAINYRRDLNECEAGTGRDKIILKEGVSLELASEIVIGGQLTRGFDLSDPPDGDYADTLDDQSEVPGIDLNGDGDFRDMFVAAGVITVEYPGLDLNGDGDFDDLVDSEGELFDDAREVPPQAITPVVSIEVFQEDVFDDSVKVHPIIYSALDDRAFTVKLGSGLILSNIILDADPSNDESGDASLATGPADGFGGLIYAEGNITASLGSMFRDGSASFEGGAIYLADALASLSLDNAAFLGNTAGLNGGAISTVNTFTGLILAAQFYFFDNEATTGAGGAIYLDGAGVGLILGNGTFFANSSSPVGDGGGAIRLHSGDRIVFINNVTIAGQDGGGGISFAEPIGTVDDQLKNSVIVGNVDGSCIGAAAVDAAFFAYVLNDGTCGANDQGGFVRTGPLPGDITANVEETADFSVLYGVVDTILGTEGDCPVGTGSTGCVPLVFEDGWSGFKPSLNDTIGAADGVPTALNSASPIESTSHVCASTDQRDSDRIDDCDAGAIEISPARGNFDEIVVVAGRSTELDILGNDLGDTSVDCNLLAVPADCLQLVIEPTKGSYFIVNDATGFPVLTYRANSGVHGIDRFSYRLDQRAIVGGLTYAGLDPAAEVILVVEPSVGLTDDDGIGGFPLFSCLALWLAGCLRRGWNIRLTLVLLALFSASAQAVTITVNSLVDAEPPILGDGLCTLREAVNNAHSLLSNDCVPGSPSRDEIVLPAGTINLVAPLIVPERSTTDIVGLGADPNSADSTIIDGGSSNRILASLSGLFLKDLVLRNGNAGASNGGAIFTSASLTLERVAFINNTAAQGGAVYLSYNTDLARTLKVERSDFQANSATLNGGALSMVGQNQEHQLFISGSSFYENIAGENGGAVDANLSAGGLQISNVTFWNNNAVLGGDALDLKDLKAPANIMNSTFVDNDAYAIDLGDVDQLVTTVRFHNSVYFSATDSGSCATGVGAFASEGYNALGAPSACDQLVTTSIEYPVAELRAALGGAPVAAAGDGEDFLPLHFAIDEADANRFHVLDAGNPDLDLELAFNTASACRAEDFRGVGRNSGSRCDIGAYELAQATAVDDDEHNASGEDAFVIIDVLENDLTGDGNYIIPYTIDLDHQGAADFIIDLVAMSDGVVFSDGSLGDSGTVRVVGKEKKEGEEEASVVLPVQDCGADPQNNAPGAFTECAVYYEPPVSALAECDEYTDTFRYSFALNNLEDLNGAVNTKALEGTVTVTLFNRPPTAESVVRTSLPGETVVFPFKLSDPEGHSILDLTLSSDPINARHNIVDQEKVYLGVGIVIDRTAETLTYYPDNVASPFGDRFTVAYTDDCGARGATAFIIEYPRNDASGDFLGNGGSLSSGVVLFTLLWWRRKRT